MNKKLKKAIKDGYNIPEPKRREEFLKSICTDVPKKPFISFKTTVRVMSVALTAVLCIAAYSVYKNFGKIDDTFIAPESSVYTQISDDTIPVASSADDTHDIITDTESHGTDNVKTTAVQTKSTTAHDDTNKSHEDSKPDKVNTKPETETVKKPAVTTRPTNNTIAQTPHTQAPHTQPSHVRTEAVVPPRPVHTTVVNDILAGGNKHTTVPIGNDDKETNNGEDGYTEYPSKPTKPNVKPTNVVTSYMPVTSFVHQDQEDIVKTTSSEQSVISSEITTTTTTTTKAAASPEADTHETKTTVKVSCLLFENAPNMERQKWNI